MTGSQPAQPFSLGTHSARGLFYLFTGAGFTKIVGVVCQILLLYLLDKRDLGLVTLVGTITAFVQLVGQSGVFDVLIQRRAFRQWAIPGFWLQLVLGVLSCILIVLCAPIATRIYSGDAETQKQLFWLLIASAPSPLPYALSVVPKAQLSHELRFRALAGVNTVDIVMQNMLTVFFACLGFGAYSFVFPVPIGGFVLMIALWFWVRPPWSMRLKLNRWRYLIGDSFQAMLSEFGRLLVDQSDYIMLGLFHTLPGLVGIYANGFKLSIQMLRLLMVNMATILIPTYAKLNDQPQKQYQGFLTAQRILALLGISGCLLQAAVAEPMARLLFPPKWYPSILVMQILSIGMATRMNGGGAYALLKSQGRFKAIRNNVWLWAAVQFVALGVVLACGGGIIGTSIVVSVVSAIAGLVMFYTTIRPFGGGWADVADIVVRPLVIGMTSVGAAWLIAQQMASLVDGLWLFLLQLVEICVVAVILNCLMARIWMRPVWNDLWLRIRRMVPHRAAA
jgi:O-antigen/teichoic acid export membrane protein